MTKKIIKCDKCRNKKVELDNSRAIESAIADIAGKIQYLDKTLRRKRTSAWIALPYSEVLVQGKVVFVRLGKQRY